MTHPPRHNGLENRLKAMKSAFSNSNMVRMREALRYLSGPKLSLFISIPFYLHTNLPGLPGFVETGPPAHGIFNFKASGFYKAGLDQGLTRGLAREASDPGDYGPDPCILGLYHIGSLGTFTQSSASDFDYWIIIDKKAFTPQRHHTFTQKLDDIIRHARESCGQKVTFFVMDQAEIRRDCYTGLEDQETLAAPKLFLKEEFYRTFLYIAGKIPLWTVLPVAGADPAVAAILEKLCAMGTQNPVNREFLDLGSVGVPAGPDILRGILWHIVKSKSDPVKALIKATMVFSHQYGPKDYSGLLCDTIKAGYAETGIDDYRADPYRTLFDRIIAFHESQDKQSLGLIKNAVFMRLCGFPQVQAPEKGSPKKQLLDRYIRQWNLKPAQIKKVLAYQTWPEREKQLLEKSFVNRLSQMYTRISGDVGLARLDMDPTEKRNLTILCNKATERLNPREDKIQVSSTYLRSQLFQFFLFQPRRHKGWELSAYRPDRTDAELLHKSDTFLGLMGWLLENRIYKRDKGGHLKLDSPLKLFESGDTPVNPDAVFLSLLPVKPLSDHPFEFPPQCRKLAVLLVCSGPGQGPEKAEFLSLNSWGELFVSQLDLDTHQEIHHRYKQIADFINQYDKNPVHLLLFQLGRERDPEAAFEIKQLLAGRFLEHWTSPSRRPLLDKL